MAAPDSQAIYEGLSSIGEDLSDLLQLVKAEEAIEQPDEGITYMVCTYTLLVPVQR